MMIHTGRMRLILAGWLLMGSLTGPLAPAAHAAAPWGNFTLVRQWFSSALPWTTPAAYPAAYPAASPTPAASVTAPAAGQPAVEGSQAFANRVGDAERLLQSRALSYWAEVRRSLAVIREGQSTYTSPSTGVTVIGPANAASGPYWLAAILVHEAWHVKQYREGRPYSGTAAEEEATLAMRQALIAMRAPQYLIDYAGGVTRTQWWNVPAAQRRW